MIDFDVITGPCPSEKPREPASKPPPPAPAKQVPTTLPRGTLLPRVPLPPPVDDAKPRP